jgi:hypothetical protein
VTSGKSYVPAGSEIRSVEARSIENKPAFLMKKPSRIPLGLLIGFVLFAKGQAHASTPNVGDGGLHLVAVYLLLCLTAAAIYGLQKFITAIRSGRFKRWSQSMDN